MGWASRNSRKQAKAGQFFGLEMRKMMIGRQMTERDLFNTMARAGKSITRQYINLLAHSKRNPPPLTIDMICDSLRMTDDERRVLHLAGARDTGYRI